MEIVQSKLFFYICIYIYIFCIGSFYLTVMCHCVLWCARRRVGGQGTAAGGFNSLRGEAQTRQGLAVVVERQLSCNYCYV